MSTLYLLKNYNNYFNRIMKKLDTVDEYIEAADDYVQLSNTNFAELDGVYTEHYVNSTGIRPDYCLVCDADDNILSRWFVLESVITRGLQQRLQLKRDVLADNWDNILDAPAYVLKGSVPYLSKLIFNKEGDSYNQIKTSETPIKDGTNGWIVGYVAKGSTLPAVTIDSGNEPPSLYKIIEIDTPISNFEYWGHESTPYVFGDVDSIDCMIKFGQHTSSGGQGTRLVATTHLANSTATPITTISTSDIPIAGYTLLASVNNTTVVQKLISTFGGKYNTLRTAVLADMDVDGTDFATFLATYIRPRHVYIKDSLGAYYLMTVVSATLNPRERFDVDSTSNLHTALDTVVREAGCFNTPFVSTNSYMCLGPRTIDCYISIISKPEYSLTFTPSTTRNKCTESTQYDMFALPYGTQKLRVNSSSLDVTLDPQIAITIAAELARTATSSIIYDMLILPYCPINKYVNMVGLKLYLNDYASEENKGWQLITETSGSTTTIKSIILYPPTINQSFSINQWGTRGMPSTTEELKVQNDCDMYRLVSPNGNGNFEFSSVRNGGIASYDVDITYKPYNPYIHIAPRFNQNYLYGTDYNDYRGLICNGDFTFGTVNDAFAQYEIQNRNYQNIFDRDIQNMEFNQKLERITTAVNGASNFATNTIKGASSAGVGGGIASGVASAAEGVANMAYTKASQREALDYAKDKFELNLGNIKALPYSISKTDARNANNKIFPYLEYYTASDEEKQALKNKIKYEGMTVNVISKIPDYIDTQSQSFISAQMIRLEDISDDSHMANEIYNEMMKGVYVN